MGARRPTCNDMIPLVTLRLLTGKSQSDMAEAIGVSQSTVTNVEAGVSPLTMKFARAYADLFDHQVELIISPKTNVEE